MNDQLFSKRYEPQPIDLGNKNSSNTLAIDLIGFNKNVLEIGTSTGYVSKILKDHENTITGIEIDREAGLISEQYCKQLIIGDVESLDLNSMLELSSFDVILLGDVLEHLKNPKNLLKNLKKFLKPEGYFVVSIPNFCHGDVILNLICGDFRYTPMGLLDETHLRFFGLKNIYQLFAESGYQIKDIQTTNLNIGDTELRVDDTKIPRDLIKFIQSLPDSGVYQYIFRAYPSDSKILPVIQEVNIKQLFFDSLEEVNKNIQILKDTISTKDTQLQELSSKLNIQEQKLSSIEKSIVWQFTMKFHNKIVRKLLPKNTRRRKYYNLGIDGGKILINDGFHAFYHSFTRYVNKDKKVDDYHLWIEKNEPHPEDIDQLKKELRNFSYHPKISIVTPVWNTDEKWLRFAIDSVTNQIYDNWELCIADGGSTKPYIKQVLNEYAQKDSRIKVKFLAENNGIAENSNEALYLATGEFIGFLDHDDELAPFALHEIVSLINQNQNIDFIYSDEDKIDQSGNRKDPFFKPDWSPDLFLSQNYLCHLSVIRKTVIDNVEGFRTGYDGSQDYDLFLRCLEKIYPSSIAHIPKILYHWRMIPGSAANDVDAKPYAITSAKKALKDALHRRFQDGEVVEGIFPSSYRIRYAIQNNPLVSIIIPTKDNVDILKQCVHSILEKTDYSNYEIVIVDNQSKDLKTFDYYNSLKTNLKIKILHFDSPFNFSAINNYAVTHVDSPYILFLNNDTEVISGGWLSAMLEHAQRGYVGAVGAKLLYPNGLIQHAGVILGITGTPGQKGVAGHSHRYLPSDSSGYFLRSQIIGDYSAVTAACLMMRKDVFKEIGGFNEELAIAFNDVDLCLRIRSKEYLIVFTPYSLLYHHESMSRGHEDTQEKQARFSREVTLIRETWGTVIDNGDPYYNPNLTLNKEDFSIRLEK